MSRARVFLKVRTERLVLGSKIVQEGGEGSRAIECSYEDCLGTMFPKFYYPAEPREVPVHDHYGRACGTKREPSYQVPHEAIEKVEVDEEVVARWERLHAAEVAVAEHEEAIAHLCDGEFCEKHGTPKFPDGSCNDCNDEEQFGSWLVRWRGGGRTRGQFIVGDDGLEGGVEWTADVSEAIRWPSQEAAEAYCRRIGWDKSDVEAVDRATLGEVKPIDTTASGKQWVLPVPVQAPSFFGPVPVGTPHEPDYAEEPRTTNGAAPVLTASELGEIYARGGK